MKLGKFPNECASKNSQYSVENISKEIKHVVTEEHEVTPRHGSFWITFVDILNKEYFDAVNEID